MKETNQTKKDTIKTIRTFTAPAVEMGAITQAELEAALQLIEEAQATAKAERLLTFREAAEQLGVCTKTIARMILSGELESKRLRRNNPRSARVFQSSVDAILTPKSKGAA
jgi:excisionase family DNA binding protein